MSVLDPEIERVDIATSTAGRPTLVFLHEGLGSVSAWRDFPAKLAAATGCGALVSSRRGYGASAKVRLPRPASFMHDEARGALPALLANANVDDAILVGHSDGASIALIYASDVGTRNVGPKIRGLVLEAPHVFVEDICVDAIARARAAYETTDLRSRLARHHADVDGAFFGWADVWLSAEFRSWNLEALLPAIRAPLMVIQGEDDAYGTLAQIDAIASQVSGPCERVIFPRCGHAPHKELPDDTLRAMTRFVRALL